jgi:hypothetical protein
MIADIKATQIYLTTHYPDSIARRDILVPAKLGQVNVLQVNAARRAKACVPPSSPEAMTRAAFVLSP